MLAEYLARLERDLVGSVLPVLVLVHVDRAGPIHGYGLIKAMTQAADGRELFKEGTVYPLLSDLEKQHLVRSRWGQGDAGPRRRYYEITAQGRQALRIAVQEWSRLRDGVDKIITDTRSVRG